MMCKKMCLLKKHEEGNIIPSIETIELFDVS